MSIKKIIGDIPIFYINLARSNDRRDKLEKTLNENDLKFTRIEAIDGNEIDVESIKSKYNVNPKMNKYEIACALSHYKAIEEVKSKKYEVALILEDDCNFEYIKYKTLPLSELIKIKDDWETIQIAGTYSKKKFFEMRSHQEELLESNESGAIAYLINQKGVDKILGHFYETKILNVSEHNMFLHLFSLETPKFSANHIIICFWDYIAWVINKKRLKNYSFCKINSRNFTYDGPT